MLKKRLFIILVLSLCLVIFLLLIFYTKALYHVAFWIFEKEDQMNEIYFKKIKFKLADRDKQIYKGDTEKYVLESQFGELWLFKLKDKTKYQEMSGAHNIIGFRLAKLYGLGVPETHLFECKINGSMQQGYIQRVIKFEKEFECLNEAYAFAFLEKKQELISEIVSHEIFSWLLCRQDKPSFLLGSSGKLYQIDMDHIFRFPGLYPRFYSSDQECLSNFVEFEGKRMLLEKSELVFNCENISRFVRIIKETPERFLKQYLTKGIKGQEAVSYTNRSIDILITRMGMLPQCFAGDGLLSESLSCYEVFPLPIFILRSCFYSLKNIILKSFTAMNGAASGTASIDMVSSGIAWNTIRDSFSDTWMEDKQDVSPVLSNDIEKLFILRRESGTLQEKLAISMYIQQVRTFRDNIDQYGITCHNKEILTPVIHSLNNLENIDIHEWGTHLKCEGLANVIEQIGISAIDGENDYMQGLIELLKGHQNKAAKYLNEAYIEDYEREDITNVRHKWLTQ